WPSVVRPRGRSTRTRRPPNTTEPGASPSQLPNRPVSLACLGPATLAVISAFIISSITLKPTDAPTSNRASRATPAIAASDTRSTSGSSTTAAASSRSTRRTAATFLFIGGGPLPCSDVLADARHPASGKVSGGGPPPHFNKTGDNLPQLARRACPRREEGQASRDHGRPVPERRSPVHEPGS